MANGKIQIDTEINSKGLDKGIKQVKSKLDGLASSLKDFKSSAAGLGIAAGLKLGKQAINYLDDAVDYSDRLNKAEKNLIRTIKNNPYFDAKNLDKLKKYADELSTISGINKDELYPMMSLLIQSGRSLTEVQDVMVTAVNMATTGTMSLDSAVKNLNKTYSGQTGELGESMSALKNMTSEQLKAGDAVALLKKQYAGMAEEMHGAMTMTDMYNSSLEKLGKSLKLENVQSGDLGKALKTGLNYMIMPFTSLWGAGTSAISNSIINQQNKNQRRADYNAMNKNLKSGGTSAGRIEAYFKNAFKNFDSQYMDDWGREIANEYADYNGEIYKAFLSAKAAVEQEIENDKKINGYISEYANLSNKELEEKKKSLEQISDSIVKQSQNPNAPQSKLQQSYDEVQNQLFAVGQEIARRQTETSRKRNETEQKLNDAIAEYEKTVKEKKDEIEIEKGVGVIYSADEELTSVLQTKLEAYKVLFESGVNMSDSRIKAIVQDISNDYVQFYSSSENDIEQKDWLSAFKKSVSSLFQEELTQADKVRKEIAALDVNYNQLSADERLEVEESYCNAKRKLNEELNKALADEDDEAKIKSLEKISKIAETVNSVISNFESSTATMTELLTTQNENALSADLAQLENEYTQGLISYEDYCEKKTELNKKSAREQYKIDLWTYYSTLASATANVASGVIKALNEAYPLNLINSAIVASAGAVQMASIIANRPTPPSFTNGGVVPGSSYSGDKVIAKVNSGEWILNDLQQERLRAMVRGSGANGAVNMPVTIENNVGANVSTKLDTNGLRVMIDSVVNSSMQQGKYTQSMKIANNKANGVRYL